MLECRYIHVAVNYPCACNTAYVDRVMARGGMLQLHKLTCECACMYFLQE